MRASPRASRQAFPGWTKDLTTPIPSRGKTSIAHSLPLTTLWFCVRRHAGRGEPFLGRKCFGFNMPWMDEQLDIPCAVLNGLSEAGQQPQSGRRQECCRRELAVPHRTPVSRVGCPPPVCCGCPRDRHPHSPPPDLHRPSCWRFLAPLTPTPT